MIDVLSKLAGLWIDKTKRIYYRWLPFSIVMVQFIYQNLFHFDLLQVTFIFNLTDSIYLLKLISFRFITGDFHSQFNFFYLFIKTTFISTYYKWFMNIDNCYGSIIILQPSDPHHVHLSNALRLFPSWHTNLQVSGVSL